MWRQFIVGAAALAAFVAGAGAAQITLYRALQLNIGPNPEDVVAPPSTYLAMATLVETDPTAHALVLDAIDPYAPTSTIRLRITYDASTTIQSDVYSITMDPMSDARAAALTPGEPLFITILRTAGVLRAQTIRFPGFRRLLSSPS